MAPTGAATSPMLRSLSSARAMVASSSSLDSSGSSLTLPESSGFTMV